MEIVLDGHKFKSSDELHDLLKQKLGLPEYYGKNLDALWDCLTGWIDLPLTIVWRNFSESERYLGSYAQKVLKLFRDAEQMLEGFHITLD
jgi:ribonuclease inhibitor